MRYRVALILAFASAILTAQDATKPKQTELSVEVVDISSNPMADVLVAIRNEQGFSSSVRTDAAGRAAFKDLRHSRYSVAVSKPGFQTMEKQVVDFDEADPPSLQFTLSPAQVHKEEVKVRADVPPIENGGAGQNIPSSVARELPSRPVNVGDALPLIPGIHRSPQGGLVISGTGEQRSALIVNSTDVTDPATGQFGTTVPIDSVQSLDVLQTPFLAEYGRFTSALVSVETRRGTDNWKWDLNDPFPDFRIRSYHLRGIKDATPRLNLKGPIIPSKLYVSEGFEYEVRKTSVITLSYPQNQQTTEGVNSFSQFDYIVSPDQLLTATFHWAPQHLKSVNLDTFDPQSTVPDATTHADTATLSDKLTIKGGDLFENALSYTRFTAGVWPKGPLDLTITPEGNSGNYFAQQQRSSSRESWLSSYSLHPLDLLGVHNLKAGAYIAPSSEEAQIVERPFNILNSTAQLLQSVAFTNGAPIKKTDLEMAFFGQDHWLLTPAIALDIGVRSESQALTEALRVAPRVGLAWMPFAQAGTTVRGGVGLFYDHVPLNVFGFNQYPSEVVTTYDSPGLALPPIEYRNALGQISTRPPFVFHENTPGDFSPRSTNWSVQIEQPVGQALKLKASYTQNDSAGLPIIDPSAPPPNSTFGTMLLNGTGQSRYRQFELTGRLRLQRDKQQLFFSYLNSQTRGDVNDFGNYLGTFPSPIIRPNQFGTLPGNLPHRFLAWGLVHLPWKMQIAPIFEWRSGLPYLVTDAAQAYVGTAYGQRYPTFLSFDARVSKDFKINTKYTLRLSVSGNNLTNHFNPDSVYSNTDAALYGTFFGQHKRRYMLDFDVIF